MRCSLLSRHQGHFRSNLAKRAVVTELSLYAQHARSFIALGFSPIPRVHRDGQARPGIKAWSTYCLRKPSKNEVLQWKDIPGADLALCCGYDGFMAIDVDTNDSAICEAVFKALPGCRIGRFGSKGFALLVRFAEGPRKGFTIFCGEGENKRPLVEIMGTGRNITIPPSIHTKGHAYVWLDPQTGQQFDARPALDELPVVTEEDLERLKAALAPWASPERTAKPRAVHLNGSNITSLEHKRYKAFAEEALRQMARELSLLSGGRNAALNSYAYKIAWALEEPFAVLNESTIVGCLIKGCRENGLVADDGLSSVEATIDSGLRDGRFLGPPELAERQIQHAKKKRRQVNGQDIPENGDPNVGSGAPKKPPANPLHTENAIARQFAELYEKSLRYISVWGKWVEYTGVFWKVDDTLAAFDLVRGHCETLSRDVGVKASLESSKTISAVEKLARGDRRVVATVDQWDRDRMKLNTPAGTIDLMTGELGEHRGEDYMLKCTRVSPDAAMETPHWTAFLNQIMAGDAQLIDYLQRVLGYCLTGTIEEHALFFCYGKGANGKSTFVSAFADVFGDYAKSSPIEMLTHTKNDRHPTELARLHGARLVSSTETQQGRRWDETKIKALTGGDKIVAHYMFKDFFEFDPNFKIVVCGNHRPGIHSVDEAIRRRLHLIPFSVIIPKAERDDTLKEKLKAEGPGILNWAIQGTLKWLEQGLDAPPAVQEATEEYLQSEDETGIWLDECTERDSTSFCTATLLFNSWRSFAERRNNSVGTMRLFMSRIRDREKSDLKETRRNIGMGFTGIRLKRDIEPQPDFRLELQSEHADENARWADETDF